ncbi:OmpH family outer membrane protein [Paracoccus sp. SCSIO 75233]|uniref:OmpH family outer membrane protein n=1 Tax=Paracoccus sp. SCSIO 75233 TaxID=3017782 RepID=UPI0022EFF0CF|nr:OmpH family outer membrane protein [Paracoccus sp. SCSIO 75233]WBU54180.1 OmpH family outer membrane protein [Paracoccus sp. SCSIO 75233]
MLRRAPCLLLPALIWAGLPGVVLAQADAPPPLEEDLIAAQFSDDEALPDGLSRAPDPVPVDVPDETPFAVVVLDFDIAYANSAWGRHTQDDLQAEAREIEAENTRLEAQLTAEEQALTAERATLSAAEFRRKAEAFDDRAQTIRRERAQVLRDLSARAQADRNAFIEAALPVVATIMQDRRAAIVLDRSQIILTAAAVDITDELVARLDEQVGEGSGLPELEDTVQPTDDNHDGDAAAEAAEQDRASGE